MTITNPTIYMLKKRKAVFLALFLLVIGLPMFGQSVYVDSAATGNGDGSSFANAYTDLQDALLNGGLGNGDTLFVSKGTYYPDTGSGNRDMAFFMISGVLIIGGYDAQAGDTTFATRDAAVNKTIMSGDIGVAGDSTDNSYNVLIAPGGLSSISRIDGFWVREGNADKSSGSLGDRGGGMHIGGNASPTVQNMVFEHNYAKTFGGGIYANGRFNNFINCTFQFNNCPEGGGLYFAASGFTHYPPVVNCIFRQNYSSTGGGAIKSHRKLSIINSTFNGNEGTTAAVDLQTSDMQIRNSIFWGDSVAEISISGATVDIDSCIIEGGCPAGGTCAGVANADPLFLSAPEDLSFGSTSPAFDAGQNSFMITDAGDMDYDAWQPEQTPLDILYNDRIGAGSSTVDLGAIEFQCVAPSFTANPADSTVCLNGGVSYDATLDGVTPMTFQWQESTNGGATWNNISDGGSNPTYAGSDSSTMTMTNVPIGHDGYDYRVYANNACGNDTSGLGDLTIDNVDPSFTVCHSNDTVNNDPGNCFANYTYAAVTASDNCNVDSTVQVAGLASGMNYPVGLTTNTFVAYDPMMRTDTCTFTVLVVDVDVPTITSCPSNIVQSTDSAFCGAVVTWAHPTITDACQMDLAATDTSDYPGDTFSLGVSNVTYAAFDTAGNTDTCTFSVTISDTRNPTVICATTTVQLDGSGNGTLLPADVDGGSFDGCGILSSAVSPNSFNCGDVGTVLVTMVVNDNHGNSDSCGVNITVDDTVSPSAVCQNITIMFDSTGAAPIVPASLDNGSTDACGIITRLAVPDTLFCGASSMDTVQLAVIDVNGNIGYCNSVVTVQDTIKPIASCQPDTMLLDSGASTPVNAANLDAGSTDACGLNFSSIPASFSCADSGLQAIQLIVTDPGGNSDTCATTIFISDTLGPVMVCRNDTVYLDAAGNKTITINDVDGGTGDACGIDTMTFSAAFYTCGDTGMQSITLIATDLLGNTDSCVANIYVADTVRPTALCQTDTVTLDVAGNGNIDANALDAGSTDACGILPFTSNPSTVNCGWIGSNPVSLIVNDVNGNVDSCTVNVVILDTTPPTASCVDDTLFLDSTGSALLTAADIDGGSIDACGIMSRTLSKSSFDCNDIGLVVVTLTLEDTSNNASNCNSQVLVLDTMRPDMNCSAAIVHIDGAGQYVIDTSDINNASTDNCGIDTMYIGSPILTCGDFGNSTTWLIGSDLSGNSDSCSATVTLIDSMAPTAVCTNTDLQLGTNGLANLNATDIDGGSNDNCSIDSMWVSKKGFACVDFGPNNVDLIVLDNFGIPDTCTAVVTVVDTLGNTELPVNIGPDSSICGNDTINLDAGSGYQTYSWSTGSSNQAITITSAGTYHVTVTDSVLCIGRDTVTFLTGTLPDTTIQEYAKPVICTGDTVALVADTGFAAYSWSTGDTTHSIGVTTSGTYVLTYYDVSGCFLHDTSVVNFEIWTSPVAQVTPTGTHTICSDDSITLDAGGGYFSYDWSNGATTQWITVNLPGVYQVIVFNGFGCSDTSNYVIVDTVPAALPPQIFPIGDSIMSSPSPFYQWNLNGNPILGATDQYYYPQTTGDYTVTITDTNGCSQTSETLNVFVSVSPTRSVSLEVYPNPNQGEFNIRISGLPAGAAAIRMYDVYGRMVRNEEVRSITGDNTFRVEAGNLSSGVYFVEFECEGMVGRKRIVVE